MVDYTFFHTLLILSLKLTWKLRYISLTRCWHNSYFLLVDPRKQPPVSSLWSVRSAKFCPRNVISPMSPGLFLVISLTRQTGPAPQTFAGVYVSAGVSACQCVWKEKKEEKKNTITDETKQSNYDPLEMIPSFSSLVHLSERTLLTLITIFSSLSYTN